MSSILQVNRISVDCMPSITNSILDLMSSNNVLALASFEIDAQGVFEEDFVSCAVRFCNFGGESGDDARNHPFVIYGLLRIGGAFFHRKAEDLVVRAPKRPSFRGISQFV